MNPHVCPTCNESFPSWEDLRRHMRAATYPTHSDQGPTGTLASGQSGATPPTGTGGVTTP